MCQLKKKKTESISTKQKKNGSHQSSSGLFSPAAVWSASTFWTVSTVGKAPAGTKVFQPGPAMETWETWLAQGPKMGWRLKSYWKYSRYSRYSSYHTYIYIYISQEHCGTLLDRSWDISTIINNEMESSGNGDKSRLKMRSLQKWRGWEVSNPWDAGSLRTGFQEPWIVIIPYTYIYIYIKGSAIPEPIINQQGWQPLLHWRPRNNHSSQPWEPQNLTHHSSFHERSWTGANSATHETGSKNFGKMEK